MKRLSTIIIAALATVAGCSTSAPAQSPALPTSAVEEVMVKTSLLTLNDANLTGNYDVMFAKMAKPFRDSYSADTLKQAFKSFAGHHIDAIAAMPIISTSAPVVDGRGALLLRGRFDTTPSRLTYELDFSVSEGEWKLVAIDVKVRSLATSASAVDLVAHAAADLAHAEGRH
ncbi:MAG: hypothetical protein HY852_24420 [Bradyrhizobium sp.]|uniref:hypothetical protein n=1 Tax=Bradyrhizobium sp. TaxID=376 RepID=UPI0025BC8C17|nr:hypothetical protein [Bradyrhizobium sp.]MBI5264953.1 hypothetical protein [Bradyrhizobium sp.]